MGRTRIPQLPIEKKISLTLGETLALTSLGEDRLKAYIASGRLKARRNEDADGNAVGNYVIRREDLDVFLESLPRA